MGTAIVDVQGFMIGSKFILKEAAVLIRGTRQMAHWVFTPPIPWVMLDNCSKRQCMWLTKHHHGLSWTDGYTKYAKAKPLLKSVLHDVMIVITKGSAKKKWLEKLLGSSTIVYNIEEMEDDNSTAMPAFSDMSNIGTFTCAFHDGTCALQNVLKLYNFLSIQ